MEKVYSEKEVQRIVQRYRAGDEEAGRILSALAAGRKHEVGGSYSDAVYYVLQAPTQRYSPRETDPAEIRNAGAELDSVARNIEATGRVVFAHGDVEVGRVDYREAHRLAILSNPILGSQYTGHEILPDGEAFEMTKRVYGGRVRRYSPNDYTTLSNIVNAHRLPDNGIDWAAADRAVMLQPESVRRGAAQYELNRRVDEAMQNAPGGSSNIDRESVERLVRDKYPEITRMARTGESSVTALRVLFWQRSSK